MDSDTPICDLLEKLLSPDVSPGTLSRALDVARPVEAAMLAMATTASGSTDTKRERERLKKQRQRARRRGTSPGTEACPISSKTQDSEITKERKKPKAALSPGDSPPADDWPEDFIDQFWKAFPPFRRQAKAKVAAKLARIRAQTGKQQVTWETLFGGVLKFAATSPGDYAPAPMVWLNDGRWDREYGPPQRGGSDGKTQGSNGSKVGFSGIAARIRHRIGGIDDLPPDEPSGDLPPRY